MPEVWPLSGEELQGRTSSNSNEAKVSRFRNSGLEVYGDIDTGIFWLKGFRPQCLSLSQQVFAAVPCYEWAGKEKSLQRNNLSNRPCYMLPLVFPISGSMGRECQKF